MSGERGRPRRTGPTGKTEIAPIRRRLQAEIASGVCRSLERVRRHLRQRGGDGGALPAGRVDRHLAALRLDAVAHAEQAVARRDAARRCRSRRRCRAPRPRPAPSRGRAGDDDAARLGVLGDVGQRLLDQAVDRELRPPGSGSTGLEVARRPSISLPGANSRSRISSAATRPRLLSDEGRRSSMIRRFSAMPLFSASLRWARRSVDLGASVGPRRDLSRGDVELGRGEQGAELVVQLAREPAALVLADGLQVLGELASAGRCAPRPRPRGGRARPATTVLLLGALRSRVAVWRRYMKSASRLSAAIAVTPMRLSSSVW